MKKRRMATMKVKVRWPTEVVDGSSLCKPMMLSAVLDSLSNEVNTNVRNSVRGDLRDSVYFTKYSA